MSRPILPFDDFKAVYEQAYDLGLKGCTTFRPNDVTGSVLSTAQSVREQAPLDRAEVLPGFTYKLRGPRATMPSTSP